MADLLQSHEEGAVEVVAPWPVWVQGKKKVCCWVKEKDGIQCVSSVLRAIWHASGGEGMAGARLYAVQASRAIDPNERLVDLDRNVRLCVVGKLCGGMMVSVQDNLQPMAGLWPEGSEKTPGARYWSNNSGDYYPMDDVTAARTRIFANLPPRELVPQFNPNAGGCPAQWNAREEKKWSSRHSHKFFDRCGGVKINLQKFQTFLNMRKDANQRPLDTLLGYPLETTPGMFRIPWGFYDATSQNPRSEGGGASNWCIAWHGCKMEALYQIMWQGKLRSSGPQWEGSRITAGARGVYCFKDDLRMMAFDYSHWVPLCRDGIFWRTAWELRVDRSVGCTVSKSHWVQPEGSVRMVALWVQCVPWYEMEQQCDYQQWWDPMQEGNPYRDMGGHSMEPPPPPPPQSTAWSANSWGRWQIKLHRGCQAHLVHRHHPHRRRVQRQ